MDFECGALGGGGGGGGGGGTMGLDGGMMTSRNGSRKEDLDGGAGGGGEEEEGEEEDEEENKTKVVSVSGHAMGVPPFLAVTPVPELSDFIRFRRFLLSSLLPGSCPMRWDFFCIYDPL